MFEDIGDNIREIRKKKNMTQTELSQRLGKSLRTIQKYESGEITPPLEVLKELSDVLDVRLYELFKLMSYDFPDIQEVTDNTLLPVWEMLGISNKEFLERCRDPLGKSIYEDLLGEEYIHDSIERAMNELEKKSEKPFSHGSAKSIDTNEKETQLLKITKVPPDKDYYERISREFFELNMKGQKKAVEMVKLLTKIPEYQISNDKEGE